MTLPYVIKTEMDFAEWLLLKYDVSVALHHLVNRQPLTIVRRIRLLHFAVLYICEFVKLRFMFSVTSSIHKAC